MWLISFNKHHIIDEFTTLQKQMELNLQELTIIKEVVSKAKSSKVNKLLREEAAYQYYEDQPIQQKGGGNKESIFTHIMLPSTRSMAKRTKRNKGHASSTSVADSNPQETGKGDIRPVISEGRRKWKRIPREPIPQLSDISSW
jgi:hypothetical protein